MSGCGYNDEVIDTGHDLGGRDIRDSSIVIIAVIKVRIRIEVDPGFVDAARGNSIADPFTEHDGDHNGEDVGKGSGELEHDDHDRNSHSGCTAEGRGGTDNGVGAWCDAGDVWFAGAEDEEFGPGGLHDLHGQPDGSAVQRSDGHGGKDDAGGDLESECEASEEDPQ